MMNEWEQRKNEYQEGQEAAHQAINALKESYLAKDADAIREYCDMVLARSE